MFRNILLPIDIEDEYSWKLGLPKTLELLKCCPHAKLHVISVVQNYGFGVMEEYFPKNWMKELMKKTSEALNKIIHEFIPESVKVSQYVEKGVVYQLIIDKALEVNVDLIIMAAHHPDRSNYLLGPNVAKVVRHAENSVLVLRNSKN